MLYKLLEDIRHLLETKDSQTAAEREILDRILLALPHTNQYRVSGIRTDAYQHLARRQQLRIPVAACMREGKEYPVKDFPFRCRLRVFFFQQVPDVFK